MSRLTKAQIADATTAIVELQRYVHELTQRRARDAGTDLITALRSAEADGDRLTHDETVTMIANLLAGVRMIDDSGRRAIYASASRKRTPAKHFSSLLRFGMTPETNEPVEQAVIDKEHRLIAWFRERESVLVGFSGGVDSAYLACVAIEALGPANVLAVRMLR